MPEQIMPEAEINRITHDDNTQDWDGCTLPSDEEVRASYSDEFNKKWDKFVEENKNK